MAENFNIQVSFKTKSGTLINLRAGDEDEMNSYLQSMANLIPAVDDTEALIAAMETVYAVMAPDRGAGGGNRGGYNRNAGGGGASAPATAAPAAAAPAGGKVCAHGQMVHKTGVTKSGPRAGQPWSGWFCPADRNDPTQCSPDFS